MKNNFNWLRLIFSTLVIFSHSFDLTGNSDFLFDLTKTTSLGAIAVAFFFVLSGYLIFQSVENSKSLFDYFWKRSLRLFPALLVMLCFSMGVMVLLNYKVVFQKDFWYYLPNNLSLYNVQYNVPGMFVNNPYPKATNGSLWSLAYEFSMYIAISFLFFIKSSITKRNLLILGFLISVCLTAFNPNYLSSFFNTINLESILFYKLSALFFGGALMNFVKFRFNWLVFVILLISLAVSFYFGVFHITSSFIFPLLIILLGEDYFQSFQLPKKLGDISYGVYIYAFFIQQVFMNFLNLSPILLFTLSTIVTYILSYFSWHFVEKKMKRFKTIYSPQLQSQ
ncbi:Acyltransferase family [Chryseobacterium nakagawai]|uniref:Acyltransferase n=1 Tax=Chryseobacterium nakagawai TaxID=1241982 RepID=A0AAD1DR18_CHRNA|nr:acyltransferase [Chryseobacterium nakagawai]AZA90409.1 acyltransferase [Chryseobacterium nakagawai]VEH21899.1 Acyltransferase family [Chryseobacterium nakagawai]